MRWMRLESPGEAGVSSAKSRLLAGLLLIFCCWHAAFLVISIIPRRPGQDEPGNRAMDHYRLLTGSRQLWNMFETITVVHSLDARFEAVDETGGKITAGCVLPGFKPYPKPENSRYYVLFHRLLSSPADDAFRKAYLRSAVQLLSAQRGPGPGANWSLVMDAEFTRNLYYSRRDGQLVLPDTRTFAPANQGGDSP